jgi:hypothetical protein
VTATTTLTVNKQTPTLSVMDVTANYGDSSITITADLGFTGVGLAPTTTNLVTFKIGGLGTFTASCVPSGSPIICTYVLPLAGLSSGVYTITAKYAGDTNYKSVSTTATLTYGDASSLSFSVASPQHTMYPTIALTATSNSGGAITYSLVSGPATVTGSTATLTGVAGTVVVKASQAQMLLTLPPL